MHKVKAKILFFPVWPFSFTGSVCEFTGWAICSKSNGGFLFSMSRAEYIERFRLWHLAYSQTTISILSMKILDTKSNLFIFNYHWMLLLKFRIETVYPLNDTPVSKISTVNDRNSCGYVKLRKKFEKEKYLVGWIGIECILWY